MNESGAKASYLQNSNIRSEYFDFQNVNVVDGLCLTFEL